MREKKDAVWIGKKSGELNRWEYNGENIMAVMKENSKKYSPEKNSILFRKVVHITKTVVSATVETCGLGYYELHVNGVMPDPTRVLAPVISDYNKKISYDTYDVRNLLKTGDNALCMELGGGWFTAHEKWWGWQLPWYGNPRLFFEMRLVYADGSEECVRSGGDWKWHDGAIVFNCVYDGEIRDGNLEPEGWMLPEYDDGGWTFAQPVEAPSDYLVPSAAPPVRIIRDLQPVAVYKIDKTRYLYDFGENVAAIPRITLRGKKGQSFEITFAEESTPSHTLNKRSMLNASNTDIYILKGEGEEVYQPKFTWHGYRYAMSLLSDTGIEVISIVSRVIHSDLKTTGSFCCANKKINRLHEIIKRTILSCSIGVPVDCPQREERLPWLGDSQAVIESCVYNFDMRDFYKNWLEDIRLGQHRTENWFQYACPWPYYSETTTEYASTFAIVAEGCYNFYGDPDFVRDSYGPLTKFISYLESVTKNGTQIPCRYGDWCSLEKFKNDDIPEYTGAIFACENLRIAAKFAELLNRPEEAAHYARACGKLKELLLLKYYDSSNKIFGNGSQFSLSMALYFGLIPQEDAYGVAQSLQRRIELDDGHIIAGIFGAKFIMEVFTRLDLREEAYALLTKEGFPGFFDMTGHGRTSLPEYWDGLGSGNHMMFGSADGVLYKLLGGIELDRSRETPLRIKPFVPGDMDSCACSVEVPEGTVCCRWEKKDGVLLIHTEIPAGLRAEYCPFPMRDYRLLDAGAYDFEYGIR